MATRTWAALDRLCIFDDLMLRNIGPDPIQWLRWYTTLVENLIDRILGLIRKLTRRKSMQQCGGFHVSEPLDKVLSRIHPFPQLVDSPTLLAVNRCHWNSPSANPQQTRKNAKNGGI